MKNNIRAFGLTIIAITCVSFQGRALAAQNLVDEAYNYYDECGGSVQGYFADDYFEPYSENASDAEAQTPRDQCYANYHQNLLGLQEFNGFPDHCRRSNNQPPMPSCIAGFCKDNRPSLICNTWDGIQDELKECLANLSNDDDASRSAADPISGEWTIAFE